MSENKKPFDKNQFKKSQDTISIFFFILAGIAIISLICGFAIPGGVASPVYYQEPMTAQQYYNNAYALDASPYYGTYYGEYKSSLLVLEITPSKCEFSIDGGLSFLEESYKFDSYKVLSPYDSQMFDPDAPDCNAIVVNTEQDTFSYIYLFEDHLYCDKIGVTLVKDEMTFDDVTEDPNNYFGTYYYSDFSYISFYQSGIAVLNDVGEITEYEYIYADKDWIADHSHLFESSLPDYSCLFLYDDESETIANFEIFQENEIRLDGNRLMQFLKRD